MDARRPEPPEGVRDLHAQPGLALDDDLQRLHATLETDLDEETFTELTRYLSENETPAEPTENYRKKAFDYVAECITYRNSIRPDGFRTLDELPDKIDRVTAGSWVQYFSRYDMEHDRPESDADTHQRGKYLFFAPENAYALETILFEQFQERPFGAAKIPTKNQKDDDWVLCLYQNDNRYWYDLRDEYHNPPTVRFRGFKSNEKTRQNEYSEQYRDKQ